MSGGSQRVPLILFSAAVLVPSAALIVLGVRIARDNREVQWARQTAGRRQIVAEAKEALSKELAPILGGEIRSELQPGQHYRYPETVFLGWAEGDKLTLPWEPERDAVARSSSALLSESRFATILRNCDQVKSQRGAASTAGACYEHAISAAVQPGQAAYARWLWALDLSESGQSTDAARLYRVLLRSAPGITDENGVPLVLLAAQALVQDVAARREIVGRVQTVIASRPWLSPMSCYLSNQIIRQWATDPQARTEQPEIEDLVRRSAAGTHLLQQAERLQSDFAAIRDLLKNRPANSWAAYGPDPWLVAAGNPAANSTAVIVVSAPEVLANIAVPGAVRLTGATEPEGEVLGDSYPGLKLVLSNEVFHAAKDLQRSVLTFSLVVVIAATFLAAYLLWRDLRREMRVSELRTQFVSSVSHELKTPLTAIRMFAETLQMGRCVDRETQEEYLGTIVCECERLSRLVDGVLLFSKAEQGKRPYRLRPIQVADSVRDAVRALEHHLSQSGFRLHLDLENDLPLVSGDRDAIEQAVLNLLSNAMKYSDDARDIELRVYSENGEVVIRVADHGIGIAPEDHGRIFEKFYRAATKYNQLTPGAGLGLALVAQIVKAHDGIVEVDSAPGKGSAFLLRFPVPVLLHEEKTR